MIFQADNLREVNTLSDAWRKIGIDVLFSRLIATQKATKPNLMFTIIEFHVSILKNSRAMFPIIVFVDYFGDAVIPGINRIVVTLYKFNALHNFFLQ